MFKVLFTDGLLCWANQCYDYPIFCNIRTHSQW